MKILDWDAVRKYITETQPLEVVVGVIEDFFWTADTIYRDGEYLEEHGAFPYSSWATPGFIAILPSGEKTDFIEVFKECQEEDLQRIRQEQEETAKRLRDLATQLRIEQQS